MTRRPDTGLDRRKSNAVGDNGEKILLFPGRVNEHRKVT